MENYQVQNFRKFYNPIHTTIAADGSALLCGWPSSFSAIYPSTCWPSKQLWVLLPMLFYFIFLPEQGKFVKFTAVDVENTVHSSFGTPPPPLPSSAFPSWW